MAVPHSCLFKDSSGLLWNCEKSNGSGNSEKRKPYQMYQAYNVRFEGLLSK